MAQQGDDDDKGSLATVKYTLKHTFGQDPNNPSGPMLGGFETHSAKTSAGFGGTKRRGFSDHSDRTSPFASKYKFDQHEANEDEVPKGYQGPKWQDDASKCDLERQEENAREKVAELYDVLKEKAASARDTVVEKASGANDSLKEYAKDVKDKAKDIDKRHVETKSETAEAEERRRIYPS